MGVQGDSQPGTQEAVLRPAETLLCSMARPKLSLDSNSDWQLPAVLNIAKGSGCLIATELISRFFFSFFLFLEPDMFQLGH